MARAGVATGEGSGAVRLPWWRRPPSLRGLLCWLRVDTSPATERGWAVARVAVVGITGVGSVLFLRETPAYTFVLALLAFALLYDTLLVALLLRGRLYQAFAAGFVLDNATLLAGWWAVARAQAGTAHTNDLYLILFPILSVGVARLGWLLGAAYTALWLAWMAWSSVHYYGPGSYDVAQLPIRLLFLATAAGLTVRLVSRLNQERRRAEDQWARAEAATRRYRTLHESMGDAVLVASADGRLVDVNPATCRLLETPADALRGRRLHELVCPQYRPSFERAFHRALAGGEVLTEVALCAASGASATVELRGMAVEVAGERLFHGVARDLTERRRLEQQLIQQERLRAVGEMASGIAHDFNNALSPIVAFSELLLAHPRALEDRERAAQYVRMINTAARDAASVVARLRQFYRREDGESLRAVDLNRVVEETVSLTRPRWKDQAEASGVAITVCTELGPVPAVRGSEADLREALANLVFNAVDAIPQAGTIALRTRSEGAEVVLEVSDTGVGMSAEVQQRCLEPFFTTKGAQGTGLGLAVVYGIVRRHGGTVTVESQAGRGTTFTLRLPAHQEAPVEHADTTTPTPARRLRVLVVEDEPLVLDTVVECLTADGHTVVSAASGRQALEKFTADDFDVVLTDWAMPGMNGDQLAGAIKRLSPASPVIVLSGFGDTLQPSAGTPANVDAVLSKPVTLDALRAALAQVR